MCVGSVGKEKAAFGRRAPSLAPRWNPSSKRSRERPNGAPWHAPTSNYPEDGRTQGLSIVDDAMRHSARGCPGKTPSNRHAAARETYSQWNTTDARGSRRGVDFHVGGYDDSYALSLWIRLTAPYSANGKKATNCDAIVHDADPIASTGGANAVSLEVMKTHRVAAGGLRCVAVQARGSLVATWRKVGDIPKE